MNPAQAEADLKGGEETKQNSCPTQKLLAEGQLLTCRKSGRSCLVTKAFIWLGKHFLVNDCLHRA